MARVVALAEAHMELCHEVNTLNGRLREGLVALDAACAAWLRQQCPDIELDDRRILGIFVGHRKGADPRSAPFRMVRVEGAWALFAAENTRAPWVYRHNCLSPEAVGLSSEKYRALGDAAETAVAALHPAVDGAFSPHAWEIHNFTWATPESIKARGGPSDVDDIRALHPDAEVLFHGRDARGTHVIWLNFPAGGPGIWYETACEDCDEVPTVGAFHTGHVPVPRAVGLALLSARGFTPVGMDIGSDAAKQWAAAHRADLLGQAEQDICRWYATEPLTPVFG